MSANRSDHVRRENRRTFESNAFDDTAGFFSYDPGQEGATEEFEKIKPVQPAPPMSQTPIVARYRNNRRLILLRRTCARQPSVHDGRLQE